MTEPIQRIELEVSIDYGQVYIFDPTTGDTPGSDAIKSQGGGLDSYRLQLWLRESDTPAVLRRSWAGWQKIMG
jgi:hypothetical protein